MIRVGKLGFELFLVGGKEHLLLLTMEFILDEACCMNEC